MKTLHARLTLALAVSALALPVFAQSTNTPNIDAREANQQRRIDQGERSGALTPREANRLEKGEAHIDRAEDRMKADGKVTPRERMRMEHMENRESRAIHREKHDRQHDFNHDGKMDHPRMERRQRN